MPATTTATWTVFVAGTKAKSSEINLNFDWLGENLYPHYRGSTTDAAYDIGASAARWRRLWLSGGINPTTTAGGIALFTTAVANASVGFEIAGTTKAMLCSRMTTTERNALTAVNGMWIYNTTTQKFNIYENGAWTVMGASFGFKETQTAGIALVASTITAYTGSGRILGIFAENSGVGAIVPVLSMTVDGVGYTLGMTSGAGYFTVVEDFNAATTTAFLAQYTSAAYGTAPRPFSFSFQTSFELKATGNTASVLNVKVLYETAT